MTEPTLSEVFGAGATCTNAAVTIPAAYFLSQGLTIGPATHAESLLVAIMIATTSVLTETARGLDLVNRNVTVTYAGQDTISQLGNQYQRDVWSVVAYKSTLLQTIDPSEY